MTHEDMLRLIGELEQYGNLENDEHGESTSYLCFLARYSDYLSEEFNIALENELKDRLFFYINNTIIVDEEITETRKVKRLERINE